MIDYLTWQKRRGLPVNKGMAYLSISIKAWLTCQYQQRHGLTVNKGVAYLSIKAGLPVKKGVAYLSIKAWSVLRGTETGSRHGYWRWRTMKVGAWNSTASQPQLEKGRKINTSCNLYQPHQTTTNQDVLKTKKT